MAIREENIVLYFLLTCPNDISKCYYYIGEFEKQIYNQNFKNISDICIKYKRVDSLTENKLLCKNYEEICKLDDIENLVTESDVQYNIKYGIHIYDIVFSFANKNHFEVQYLSYLQLVKNTYYNKCFLIITTTDTKNLYRISHYMFNESLWEQKIWKLKRQENDYSLADICKNDNTGYNSIYFENKRRLNLKGINRFYKYVPLLRLDHNVYDILSSNFESISDDFGNAFFNYDENQLFKKLDMESINFNDALTSNSSKLRDATYINPDKFQSILTKNVIKSTIMSTISKTNIFKNTSKINRIRDLCGHMSILAMLFLAVYCQENELSSNFEYDQLIKIAILSQDFSDGILQIIENAVEYANSSYLVFRIRDSESDRDNLEHNYPNYSINKNIKYLEVIVTDVSDTDLITEFKNTASKRNNNLPINDIKISELFDINSNNNLKEWEKYYQDINNVTHHYGLKQFLKVVNNVDGYFRVISTQNKSILDGNCFYCNLTFKNKEEKSMHDKKILDNIVHLPGTEYRVLLPIEIKENRKFDFAGLGAKPNYQEFSIENKWKSKKFEFKDAIGNFKSQTGKEQEIHKFYKSLKEQFPYNSHCIIHIDGNNIDEMKKVEVIVKGIILYVCNDKNMCHKRIAITGILRTFMINFTRFMTTFYQNFESIEKMKNVQIYLINKDLTNDLIMGGETLELAYNTSRYSSYTKGEYSDCLNIIENSLIRKMNTNDSKKNSQGNNSQFAPFDLLVKENDITLFEKKVKLDLERDIQMKSFGCTLHESHMRVGSKMHIVGNFYDATLLFASSYYTSRFAYLLAEKIDKTIDSNSNIMIVGYETYSEMLIEEVEHILISQFNRKKVKSCIFEQTNPPKFKFLNDGDLKNNWECVIIVPINSTLTTHSKISAELATWDLKNKINVKLNLGIVLIRDNNKKSIYYYNDLKSELSFIENNYWRYIDVEERKIITRVTNPETVYYNVVVENKWEDPLTCRGCFGDDNVSEKPLMELNRASVIPMILAGLKEDNGFLKNELPNAPGKIELLKKHSLYGHIKHAGNHFAYYIQTEELMQDIKENHYQPFEKWLKDVELAINNQKEILKQKKICDENSDKPYIYDILVAPLHSSNATFVEHINRKVFDDAPLVIYLDSNREYRDNIKMKYSNLTNLYENLRSVNKMAIINFHYIDDSINSGNTFFRTKSLIRSLFPKEAFDNKNVVHVNLFQNIILLINRCSSYTVMNYIDDSSHYFRYIDLNISSLRTHRENSCSLCSLLNDYKYLEKCSSTNEIAEKWHNKIYKNQVRTINETNAFYKELAMELSDDKNDQGANLFQLKERYYKRLFCSHQISGKLRELSAYDKNDDVYIERTLMQLISEKILVNKNSKETILDDHSIIESTNFIISYIKSASRPFIVYRKSVLFAMFKIVSKLLDYIVYCYFGSSKDYSNEYETIILFIDLLKDDNRYVAKKSLKELFIVLLTQASFLGSKYLIRKDNIIKIFDFNKRTGIEKFELLYTEQIKRMITLNRDETIGLWIEYLMLVGQEYSNDHHNVYIDNDFVKHYGIDSEFGERIFYENSHIIYDAIEELYQKTKNNKNQVNLLELLNKYYFENYVKLIFFNKKMRTISLKKDNIVGSVNFSEKVQIEEIDEQDIKQIKNMIQLFKGLKENNLTDESEEKDICTYYEQIAKLINKICESEYVKIYGFTNRNNKANTYLISDSDGSSKKNKIKLSNSSIEMISFINEIENSKEKKTVYYDSRDQNKVFIRLIDNERIDFKMDTIFICIRFADIDSLRKKWNIRNILTFRTLIVSKFHDNFHNNIFQIFREIETKAQKLGLEKSASHSTDQTINYACDIIRDNIIDAEYEKQKMSAILLNIAADSLVSRLYVRRIKDEISGVRLDRVDIYDFNIELFKGVLEELRYVRETNSNQDVTKAILNFDKKMNLKTEWKLPIDQDNYPLLIVACLVQNAIKHGKINNEGRLQTNETFVKVNISTEEKNGIEYLVFDNISNIKNEGIDRIDKKDISGITLPALEYYFEYIVGRKIIKINKKGRFILKLPINELMEE